MNFLDPVLGRRGVQCMAFFFSLVEVSSLVELGVFPLSTRSTLRSKVPGAEQ